MESCVLLSILIVVVFLVWSCGKSGYKKEEVKYMASCMEDMSEDPTRENYGRHHRPYWRYWRYYHPYRFYKPYYYYAGYW